MKFGSTAAAGDAGATREGEVDNAGGGWPLHCSSHSITLRDYALAAVAACTVNSKAPADQSPEMRFLLEHLQRIAPGGGDWAATLADYLCGPRPSEAPLVALADELGLTTIELLTVALAAAVEDDVMVGRALAYLQAPLGGSRPTLSLLASAFGSVAPAGRRTWEVLLTGAGVRSGLLNLSNDAAPLPERSLSVSPQVCLALDGRDGFWPGTTLGSDGLVEVPLPRSVVEEARRQAAGLLASRRAVLVLRTGSAAEGRAVASLLAQLIGRRALYIENATAGGMGPWLHLRGLLPVFCLDVPPGERVVLAPVSFYSGPSLVLCGPDGSVEAAGETALSWTLATPPREERERLWQVALGDAELAAELAAEHRHGVGRIAHLGRLARHLGAMSGHERPTREDVVAASWVGEGAGLDGLAQPLTDPITDEAMVAPAALREELHALLLRCRARDRLTEGLGASARARYRAGVRALFVGPSGTGKTLAAGWLATRLGLPLYRVDLSAITSKYIGETEKNLAQLLARAEQSEVVLLFDEADSLFGKRTDVKEANDRFANAQTNYLLQRMESFDGITLLTSNSRARFDSAFTRRLDAIVDFPPPGPEERRSLWLSHLGGAHRLTHRELNRLAAAADLSGGHIRNAVLAAAVVAHGQGRPVEYADVIRGLKSEYRKQGRQLPVGLTTGDKDLG